MMVRSLSLLFPASLLLLVLTIARARPELLHARHLEEPEFALSHGSDRHHHKAWSVTNAQNYSFAQPQSFQRRLQKDYYYSAPVSSLGGVNFDVTLGNPFKGLMGSPVYPNYDYNSNMQSSLEWFYIGFDYLMKDDPDKVGPEAAFDWTLLENRIKSAASRNKHVVFSIAAHYPGWEDLNVPQYLIDAGLKLHYYPDFLFGGYSPDYGDALILKAFEQFIKAFGERYDGDQRIAFIHLGLLGFWGEWHTFPHDYVPDHARESVVKWYKAAFQKTRLQARYPFPASYSAGYGLNDGSFTYESLGGQANGGEDHWFYFHNQVKSAGQEGLWRKAPISGETRPENQPLVFKSDYARRTLNKQDFMECVNVTHASYVFHNNAFDHKYEGDELRNALFASTRMGYNFVVRKVDVAKSTATPNAVEVDVTVEQVGIAPFYYPLSLVLDCDDPVLKWPRAYQGVEALIDKGAQGLFRFEGVPATPSCLSTISLILDSKNAYRNRPIKFAQGKTGVVALSIPVPAVAAGGKAAIVDVDPDIQSPSIQMTFTMVQIINGQSKNSMPVADGTVIDLAKVGRSLNLRANVSPDDDIDVIFQFANRTVVERSDPFTLLPSRVPVPYLSFPGEKTIRVSVVDEDDDDVTLERQTLVFRIVDSAAKLL